MSNDPAPLEPDELDELLSADLDGELAAAAREHASDVDTMRARIAATPGSSERRAALSAAREILAEPAELNDLDAARLRANAVRAAAAAPARDGARHERRNRALLTASGIAACVLVVLGIALAIGRSNSSSNSSSSSNGAASASSGRPEPKVDLTSRVPALGSYTDVRRLGAVALEAARERSARYGGVNDGVAAPHVVPAGGSKETATTAPPPTLHVANTQGTAGESFASRDAAAGSSADGPATTPKRATKSSAACSAAKYAGPGDQLLMQASATLAGRPVRVYVFEGHGEHTIVVLGPNCALVNVQFVD